MKIVFIIYNLFLISRSEMIVKLRTNQSWGLTENQDGEQCQGEDDDEDKNRKKLSKCQTIDKNSQNLKLVNFIYDCSVMGSDG